ncbi:hypothetical protein FZC79_19060 [Rossellomorea vietnamensis]|uniref:Uncharacterized protein n=1 Tax=Rossellomorea vietnamensis TaxID=218284 RepID=A0A5D4K9G1_9BACI|nr:hypothetical protein [Rossellomorea vietnamensis]TYR73350.1 hypothetical protein FZC79_19060 [Rossellomorea vietnamensis]
MRNDTYMAAGFHTGRYPGGIAISLAHKVSMRSVIQRKLPSHWPAKSRCGPLSSGSGHLNGPRSPNADRFPDEIATSLAHKSQIQSIALESPN